jgi:hypothetical protein
VAHWKKSASCTTRQAKYGFGCTFLHCSNWQILDKIYEKFNIAAEV